MRVVRLEDEVWAAMKKLGKEHGTINEGMRVKLLAIATGVEAMKEQFNDATDHPSKPGLLTYNPSYKSKRFTGALLRPSEKRK